MGKRIFSIMVATAAKAGGKTEQTIKAIAKYIQNDPIRQKRGRKVVIFDTNGEYTDARIAEAGESYTARQ